MNIELLQGTLAVKENPGLDTFDPRFTDIATLVQNADYLGAASQAEEILQEEIYDIRIICYFLYGYFMQNGLGDFPQLFQVLSLIFTDNWEAVGPAKKKEKQAQNSLKWLFSQLTKKLDYEEDKKTSDYTHWLETVDSDRAGESLEELEGLTRKMNAALEEAAGPLLDLLGKLKTWLRNFQQLVYKESEPEPEEEEEISDEAPAEETTAKPASVGFSFGGGDIGVAGSYHLTELLNKLAAFEQLIRAEKHSLATLVADDINTVIANFDPKIYFPRIFAKFSLLYALNINELTQHQQNKGSIEWRALKDLYRVDLESFVNFDGDIEFTPPVMGETESPSAGEGYDNTDTESEDGGDADDESYTDNDYDDDDY